MTETAATWRAEIARDGNGNITAVTPEFAPEWVGDLIGDVIYRFRDNAGAHLITITVTGADEPAGPVDPTTALTMPLDSEAPDDAAAQPATGGVTSTGPRTPPPDAAQPDAGT
jgi:hypothetical protein